MCELCSSDPTAKKLAQRVTAGEADALRWLADDFDRLAQGEMGPHSERAQVTRTKAVHVIRFLVRDWL